jgi:hypothetical protein
MGRRSSESHINAIPSGARHAGHDGVDYSLAYIGPDFTIERREDFDPVYMKALFDYDYQKAILGYPWHKAPSSPGSAGRAPSQRTLG